MVSSLGTDTFGQPVGPMHTPTTVLWRSVERAWVRRDPPVWPFFWRGVLPLLALMLLLIYACGPLAHREIENQVRSRTVAALTEQGFGWVHVVVSGQDVTLSGAQPVIGAGDAALATARAVSCPSWAGALTCAVAVSGKFTGASANEHVAASPVTLAGATSEPAPVAAAAIAACEQSLADIVAQSEIRFASSSADIAAQSAPVLDALSRAAANCPGVIRVEGHTDSSGRAATNQSLSQARAVAVVAALSARGFPRQRLQAQGFGSSRPLADNGTPEGRARNRRIEFHVVTER